MNEYPGVEIGAEFSRHSKASPSLSRPIMVVGKNGGEKNFGRSFNTKQNTRVLPSRRER